MKLLRLCSVTMFFLIIGLSTAFAELVLIGNPNMKGKSVSKAELKSIYQLTKKKIGDINIVFVDARIPNRADLLAYLGENEKELNNNWLKARLTGSANPPKPLSEDEAVKFVGSTPNAIAVVNKEKVSGDAVVLMTIK